MIAIIAPDNESIQYLLSISTIISVIQISNTTIYEVSINNYNFLLVVSGYGKVNISKSLTLLLVYYKVDAIYQIGTAGSMDKHYLKIFGVAISTATVQYDVDFTSLGDPVATLPDMDTGIYDADFHLAIKARLAAMSLGYRGVFGVIISADKFMNNNCSVEWLRDDFRSIAVDAEGAATGQIAYLNEIPYVVVKVISNYGGCDAEEEYERFNDEAILISQQIAQQIIMGYID